MAGSVNKVILVGNLGKDPEIRTLPSGGKVASFSLATSESWRDKSTGERKEKTEWHRVAIFNENLVKIVEQYVKKGAKLYIEGALQTRKWQDQSGQERYTTEVVLQGFNGNLTMLDSRNGGGGGAIAGMAEDGPGYGDSYGGGGGSSSGASGGMGDGSSGGYGDAKRGPAKAGNGKGIDKPMDDEIPF